MNVEKLIIDIANGIARDINTALMTGINTVTYEEHAFIERFHVNFEHPHTLLIDAAISAIESPTIAISVDMFNINDNRFIEFKLVDKGLRTLEDIV